MSIRDAYRAAFALPDLLAYFLIGGAASISLITILNRYREAGPGKEPDDAAADFALSVILNNMLVVLIAGALVAEIFAPQYVWLANKGFRDDAARSTLCTAMTRIIIPAQIFFFIGSVMGSRLQVRKIFIYQAFAPLIYNLGIILGAVLLHHQFGVKSLALGVFAGMLVGYALLNSLGAFRSGLRYTPVVNFKAPAFREWLKLSLPLMIGVSLVMFDRQFLNYFASIREGGITFIGNAKDLFNAPFNVIGPAAGAASLPFFASLFQQNRRDEFSQSVARSVSRLFAVGVLVTAWMIALAPLADGPLPRRPLQPRRRRSHHAALQHPLHHARHLGRAGHLRPRLLRRQRHHDPPPSPAPSSLSPPSPSTGCSSASTDFRASPSPPTSASSFRQPHSQYSCIASASSPLRTSSLQNSVVRSWPPSSASSQPMRSSTIYPQSLPIAEIYYSLSQDQPFGALPLSQFYWH